MQPWPNKSGRAGVLALGRDNVLVLAKDNRALGKDNLAAVWGNLAA